MALSDPVLYGGFAVVVGVLLATLQSLGVITAVLVVVTVLSLRRPPTGDEEIPAGIGGIFGQAQHADPNRQRDESSDTPA